MARVTVKQISKAIKAEFGMDVSVYRDPADYYYFYSDDDDTALELARWETTSVYVYRLNHLTLEQWLETFRTMKAEGDAAQAAWDAMKEKTPAKGPLKLSYKRNVD